MLKLPISMLMMLIVFIVFLAALFIIFGSPNCNSLANQTAYSIKISVDEVVKDDFPTWNQDGVPDEDDYNYYRTASVKLCQEGGTTFWDSVFGNPPAYQIYFEKFPEGGGGTWNEAYPWSGGAASNLMFWAIMRTGVGAWKLGTKYFTAAGHASITTKFVVGRWAKFRSAFGRIFKEPNDYEKLLKEVAEGHLETGDRKIASILVGLKEKEAIGLVDEMKKMGLIKGVTQDGKMILSDSLMDVKLPFKKADGTIEELQIYVRRSTSGNIEEISTDICSGCVPYQVKPAEVYNTYLSSVTKEQAENFKKKFALDNQELGVWDTVTNFLSVPKRIRNTNFYKSDFLPFEKKLLSYVERAKMAGYGVEVAVANPVHVAGMTDGITRIAYSTEKINGEALGSKFVKMIREDFGVMSRIKTTLKLSNAEKVTDENIFSYLNKVQDEMSGVIFFPLESKWRVYEIALTAMEEASTGASTADNILNYITKNEPDILNYNSPEAIRKIINEDILPYKSAERAITGTSSEATLNKVRLTSDVYTKYMANLIKKSETQGPEGVEAWAELSSMFGLIEQNTGSLPVTVTSALHGGVKKEVKKLLYLDGPQNIANPSSWYAQALSANIALEGCQGNSICVLSQNSMEYPIYLEKAADNYSLRIWRPVNPIQQWLGIQAAIMHVPEHPRFYLVGPCFATARVWKTDYNGAKTVFIYPEKIETEGSSNYCYASSDLVNQYTAIWAVSDIISFIPTPASGTKVGKFATMLKIGDEASNMIGKILNTADPATIIQSVMEAAIAWPGAPWSPLTWDEMYKAQQSSPVLKADEQEA